MSITNRKVAILVDNYFEQSEFEVPLKRLKEVGAQVTVVGVETKDLHGFRHVELGTRFMADVLLTETTPDDYHAVVLPGGVFNADRLRMVDTARKWASQFTDEGKLIAAICHAPWLLVSADLVEGRRLTSYYTLQDDIRNAGAEWIDQPVVLDNNFITSRNPDDLPKFTEAIIQWFEGK